MIPLQLQKRSLSIVGEVASCSLILALLLVGCSKPDQQAVFQQAMDAYSHRDFQSAARIWRTLADEGNTSAQTNLGLLYYQGLGVPLDYAQAVKWYTKAAQQGEPEALYNLAIAYEEGHGVVQDYSQAVYFLRRAGFAGYTEAQLMLGGIYFKGQSVPVDYAEAMRWYEMAANQGSAVAQSLLGTIYMDGTATSRDLVKSYFWFSAAAEEDDLQAKENAQKAIELLSKNMSPQQIAEAQELLLKWHSDHPTSSGS